MAACACGCGGEANLTYIKGHQFRRWCTWEESPDTNCWEWTGYIMPSGYGLTSRDGQKTSAHRANYEDFVGPIPEGYEIDHLCRNRACCNPGHLEAVTRSENQRRGRNSKLTASQVREIHSLAPTTGRRELGRRYGVSHQTIRQILDGRIWADLREVA